MLGQFGTNKKGEKMFRKILLVLVIGSFLVGTAFAETYKEAYDAGIAKLKSNPAGARVDFERAITLGSSSYQQAMAQYLIGFSYYGRDSVKAREELEKVLLMKGCSRSIKGNVYFYMGLCYEAEENDAEAQKIWMKMITELPTFSLTRKIFNKADLSKLSLEEKKALYGKILNAYTDIGKTTAKSADFVTKLRQAYEFLK